MDYTDKIEIKDRYYDIAEATAEWTTDERDLFLAKWVDQLSKLTGPIRKKGVLRAMEELQEEGHDLIIDVRKRRKYSED